MRGNYAAVGYTYMENVSTLGVGSTDIFIRPQPYASWTLDYLLRHGMHLFLQPALTDEQRSAGSYYEWDEDAYQADNTTGWVLETPE